jgi:hypothetical protein
MAVIDLETFETEMKEQLSQLKAELNRLKSKDMTAKVIGQE